MNSFYSGFNAIASDRTDKLSIPYQGAGYHFSAAPSSGTYPVPPSVSGSATEYPMFGAPQLVQANNFELESYIKIDPDELTLYYAGTQSVQIERLDVTAQPVPGADLSGNFASIRISILKGRYRLLVSHLKYGVDGNKQKAWSAWMNGVIVVLQDYYALGYSVSKAIILYY
ncbi:hypothetical protein CORC01_03970 [Colletotrichum orchidophilum]|uniref:Uncharacterized protein n=1 Tax=Colletotrichum orchidophilum TaxID=1209926 RepID=A0A1G4BH46_9PEZI|nr:uncharacterized protein CORC01_03970 [Colletotrichum orchidophilum]OHF00653.1 hypothetical protein CORC01_03970 [Colletotrichum orchidophilum]